VSSPESQDFIPIEVAIKIVDESLSNGLKEVILSGGEPLLYKDLIQLVRYMRSKQISIVIYTSGSILDEKNQPISVPFSLIEELNGFGIKRYNLSLNSSIPSLHDEFMATKGSWDRAIQFINNCNILHEEIHIHAVLSKYNYDNFMELCFLLEQLKVTTLRILRLVPQGRGNVSYTKLNPSNIEYDIFWGQVKTLKKNMSINVNLGAHLYSLTNNSGHECSLHSNKLTISPDGTLSVCAALKGLAKALKSPNMKDNSLANLLDSDWRQKHDDFKVKYMFSCPAQKMYKYMNTKIQSII
jgi:MoaA/NifB/PqqE/SkfB family radical SAM enzyme